MENLKQASEEIWAQVPPKFFSTILRLVALVYKSFFFFRTTVLQKLFYISFSYKHCNFSRVCLLHATSQDGVENRD